ncbi:MAG: site-specific integrase [Deltaproteobacteria bacterium]|nr:site-specific integrase [Deltaproteobacteria bacterium]
MGKFIGTWAGGRIRQGRRGQPSYVIERMHGGDRRPITLKVASEREALAELALFERDPAGYRGQLEIQASAVRRTSAITLDEELVGKFLAHLRGESGGEPRSDLYIINVATSLDWWDVKLQGRELRSVTLAELQEHLDGAPGRKHKIIHLKSFCSFLRARGLLLTKDDPTLELRVPQARPEKAKRKKGHTMQEVEAVYRAVEEQAIRDVLCLRAKTGMHHTEVKRLASGEGVVSELRGHANIAGTIRFPHKNGREHIVSIDGQTLAAAKRLQARGGAPAESYMAKRIERAATTARLRDFELGALRHSFATWARNSGEEVRPSAGGLPLATVASVMGHLDPRTTAMFYDGTQVPPMVKLPGLRLINSGDPIELETRTAAK